MALVSSNKPNAQMKLLRTLEQCKQILKDDRLIIRKMVIEGNSELIKILQDNHNKKIQIKLRKFIQRQKQNCKVHKIQHTEVFEKQRPKSRDEKYMRMQRMLKNMKQFKNNLQSKKSLTQVNSLSNSRALEKYQRFQKGQQNIIFTQNQNFSAGKYCRQNYTQNQYENSEIFTPLSFLEELKHCPNGSTKKLYSETPETVDRYNYKYAEKALARNNLKETKEQILKSTLISHFGEDIFTFICDKYFPLSISCQSIYLPYRKLLEEIQIYSQSSTSSISIQSSIISSFNPSMFPSPMETPKSVECSMNNLSTTFVRDDDHQIPILAPFQSEFEAVSIDKLGQFLQKFCLKRNNEVNNIFIIMGNPQVDNIKFNKHPIYSISLERFNQTSQWRGNQLIEAFKKIIMKWGNNEAISYWKMFRVKQQKQIKQFFEVYHRRG